MSESPLPPREAVHGITDQQPDAIERKGHKARGRNASLVIGAFSVGVAIVVGGAWLNALAPAIGAIATGVMALWYPSPS